MADRKITDMSALAAGEQATGDLITVVDVSQGAAADKNKKMTMEALFQGIPGNVGIGTQTPGDYSSSANQLVIAGAGQQGITISSTDSNQSNIFFADATSGVGEYAGYIAYIHGSDAFGIGTAGSERVRIDSSGNVGVGTSAPASKLHLNATSNGEGILVQRTSTTTDDYAQLGFAITTAASPTQSAWVRAIRKGAGSDALALGTDSTERIYITPGGSVGIGTTSPSNALVVREAVDANDSAYIEIVSGNNANAGVLFSDTDAATRAGVLYDHGDEALRFFRSGFNEAARIDSSGRVGVGTSSPGSKLQVISTSVQDQLRFGYSTSVYTDAWMGTGFTVFDSIGGTGGAFDFRDDGTSRIFVDSSGNVGIGTTSPSYPLEVASSTSSTVNIVGGTSDLCRLFFSDTTVARGFFNYDHADDSLRIGVAGSERARIDSSGRLLVGTSTYAGNGRLVAAGNTGGSAGTLDITWTGSRPTAANTDIGYIRWYVAENSSANAHYASINASSDGTSSGTGDIPGRLVFSTTADGGSSPTERMRITNTGYMRHYSSDNGLDVGTAQSAGTTYVLIQGVRDRTGIAAGGSTVIRIYSNGNVQNTNNSYGALSDIKLKENIVNANSQWEDIKQVQVRNYNLIEGETHTQIGVVAQEIETVSPGLVYETPDRDEEGNDLGTVTKSVNYSVLYMKAVKALQEAMARIETLEAKVAALEAG